MPLVAILFLVLALFIMVRIPWRQFQAAWLGLILFAFGGCLLGLINLISRFGNYQLEGLVLNLLPINQPSWAWQMFSDLSLYEFMRFRLWCIVGFLVAQVGFVLAYTSKKLKKNDWLLIIVIVVISTMLIWNYDPEHLFSLYKSGVMKKDLIDHAIWEAQLRLTDSAFLMAILSVLIYSLFRTGLFWFQVSIPQKRVQIFFVGIVNIILCSFFAILFCQGGGSVLNTHTMATTLLPVANYPDFDTTYLRITPFVAVGVLLLVMLLINRYGFLGRWHLGTMELDRQIKVANEAVRLTLHSFKNRFLAIQMGMNIIQMNLERLQGDEVNKTVNQLHNVQDICNEAMKQLDNLHIQAGRLQANPGLYSWKSLIDEAFRGCTHRLDNLYFYVNDPEQEVNIWGDREYLIAMLENLLQNALDALTVVKKIGFIPSITVEIGKEYEWGYVRIIDNGIGIPRRLLRKVFRPFFTTKSTKNNWGMGLAFCHRVVKAHRGFINLYSKDGNGTSVEVVTRCPDDMVGKSLRNSISTEYTGRTEKLYISSGKESTV